MDSKWRRFINKIEESWMVVVVGVLFICGFELIVINIFVWLMVALKVGMRLLSG